MIEFALLLSLMVTMVAGVVEIGRTLWYYDALAKATRDAARSFSISAKATVSSVSVAAAKAIVVSAASSANVPNFSTSNVNVVCLDSSTYADGTCTDGTAPGGVRVEITGYTVGLASVVPGILAGTSATLSPHTTMPFMP